MDLKRGLNDSESNPKGQHWHGLAIERQSSRAGCIDIKQETTIGKECTFEGNSIYVSNIKTENYSQTEDRENSLNEDIKLNYNEPVAGCSNSKRRILEQNSAIDKNIPFTVRGDHPKLFWNNTCHFRSEVVKVFTPHSNVAVNTESVSKCDEMYFQIHGGENKLPEIVSDNKIVCLQLEKTVFYSRNFACNLCCEFFPTPDILNEHKFYIHDVISSSSNEMKESFEKPFVCDECNYRCKRKTDLKRHRLIHTEDKPFKCNLCDYRCKQIMYLKHHQMIHSSEKTFHCDSCEFKCKTSSNLKTHKTIHSGERPYACDLCELKFSQSSTLKTHKMVHSGEKPFKCDACEYKCTTSGTLKRHKTIHSGEMQTRLVNPVKNK